LADGDLEALRVASRADPYKPARAAPVVVRMKEGLELALGELVSGVEYGRQVAKLTAASWRAQAN